MPQPDEEIPDHWTMRQGIRRIQKRYADDADVGPLVTLIGDSISEGMMSFGLIGGYAQLNLGFAGIRPLDLFQQIAAIFTPEESVPMLSVVDPAACILMAGINLAGIGSTDTDHPEWISFTDDFATMIDFIIGVQPRTAIMAITPIEAVGVYTSLAEGMNEAIDNMNALIYQMALDRDIMFVNTNGLLRDPSGDVLPGCTSDGLHPRQILLQPAYDETVAQLFALYPL